MILTKHELLEFNKLNEKNHARYLVYRYKYNIYPKLNIVDEYPPVFKLNQPLFVILDVLCVIKQTKVSLRNQKDLWDICLLNYLKNV